MIRIRDLVTVTLLALGLSAVPAVAQEESLGTCAAREAKSSLRRVTREQGEYAALYGYHTDVVKWVVIVCVRSGEATADEVKQISGVVEKTAGAMAAARTEKELREHRRKELAEAPRLRAEKEKRDQIMVAYYTCLLASVRVLALNSTETADIIAQATFAACLKERISVFDVYRQQTEYFSEGVMKAAEEVFYKQLLLEAIGTRAARAIPKEPPSAPAGRL